MSSWRLINRKGKRYGKLVVLKRVRNKLRGGATTVYWLCQCDCGNLKEVQSRSLGRHTNSCGCYQKTQAITHGMCYSPEYRIWKAIRNRCYRKAHGEYHSYGGRGIKVCGRWLGKDGFVNFFKDMGKRPSHKHEIDRRNNEGDYTPDNCRWVTKEVNNRNKRTNRLLTYQGETLPLICWAERYGIKPVTLGTRLDRGWTIQKALNRSIQYKRGVHGSV